MDDIYQHGHLFLNTTQMVFQKMLGVNVQIKDDVSIQPILKASQQVQVIVPFYGSIQGQYAIVTSPRLACHLTKQVTPQTNDEELNEFVEDALMEALSCSVGNVSDDLRGNLALINYQSPRLIKGEIKYPRIPAFKGVLELKGEGEIECYFFVDFQERSIDHKIQEAWVEHRKLLEEKEKAEQTVRKIMHHISSGVVVLNHHFQIMPGASRRAREILKIKEGQKTNLEDTLIQLTGENATVYALLNWLKVAFKEKDRMDWQEELMPLYPCSEIKSLEGRTLSLAFTPVLGEQNDEMMMIIEDVTEKKILEKEKKSLSEKSKNNLSEMSMLSNINTEDLEDLILFAKEMHDVSKKIADWVENIKDGTQKEKVMHAKFLKYLNEKNQQFEEVASLIGPIVARRKLVDKVSVPREKLDALERYSSQRSPDTDLKILINNLNKCYVFDNFQELEGMAKQLASSSGKQVFLKVEEDVEVDIELVRPLRKMILQLIRNCVMHGVETVNERRIKGKVIIGEIQLKAIMQRNSLLVSVADDGRGIAIQELKKVATQRHIFSEREIASLPDHKIFDVLYLNGFSMPMDEVRVPLSGLGLTAVKKETQKLGGEVLLQNKTGVSTKVLIKLPCRVRVK